MTKFEAGFARIDITPPLGTYMSGYFEPRQSQGQLDPLFASALAVRFGEDAAIIFSVDVIGVNQAITDGMRERIAAACGLKREQVFIACTHTHTGPVIAYEGFPIDETYNGRFESLLTQAAILAMGDLKPGQVFIGRGQAPGISFIRRFRMKDGTVRTNPGINNPDILAPIGDPDETVQLVQIKREEGPEILQVNFQVHPDVDSVS